LVPSSRISGGNAKLQVSQSGAQVIGPAVGGFLIRLMGAPLVILIDAVSFFGSALFLLRIRHREEPASRQNRRPLFTEIGEGLSFVVRQPLLRRVVATTSIGNLFNTVGQAMLVLFAIRDLGIGEAGLGIALSIGAVGGLIGAFTSEAIIRLIGEGRTIAYSMLPTAVTSALVPLAAGRSEATAIAMLSISMVFFGFAVVVYNVAQVSFRQRLCPRPLLGRMNASVRFIVWGSMPIGALLGGVIGGAYGAVTALWVSFAGMTLSVLPVLLSPLRRMRDLPRALDQHLDA
jgi:predicted MFS family arabinose efflux permease